MRADFLEVLRQVIVPDDKDRSVQRTLAMVAEMRQASISELTLMLYGRALRAYDHRDVTAMLMHYKATPRAEGETAMPDLPSLELVVKRCREVRLSAERAAAEEAEAKRERDVYEREKAAGWHDPDPATKAKMDRLQRLLDEKKSAVAGMGESFAADARRRAEETKQRAAEAKQQATEHRPMGCAKCAMIDDLTPEELRRMADAREWKNRRAANQESEAAA